MTGKPIVDVKELADLLGVSVQTIRNWVRSELIPPSSYIKVERTYRFVVDDVVAALRANAIPDKNPNQMELPLGIAAPEQHAPTRAPIALYDEDEEDDV